MRAARPGGAGESRSFCPAELSVASSSACALRSHGSEIMLISMSRRPRSTELVGGSSGHEGSGGVGHDDGVVTHGWVCPKVADQVVFWTAA